MSDPAQCPRCKDVNVISEIAYMRAGDTEPRPWPAWALGLVREGPYRLRCPDCGAAYEESSDQTHDHWWNDSWTVLTRLPPGS